MRIVIVGGAGGGASAAARARRLSENASIQIIERGPYVSYANCGLPYFIGGEITDRNLLTLHTPDSLGKLLNIKVKTMTEAVKIDRQRKTVTVRNSKRKEIAEEIEYDKLILSPGALPIVPTLPGLEDPRIFTLRNIVDMDEIVEKIKTVQTTSRSLNALVLGAGFIGLETAEALIQRGIKVHLVERADQVLSPLDKEMTEDVAAELQRHSCSVYLGNSVSRFESFDDYLLAELVDGQKLKVDVVIIGIGVKPESTLAKEADLDIGVRESIKVNPFQQTSDPDIYAVGDTVETSDLVLGRKMVNTLGGPANRQGRTAADHIFLGAKAKPYPGSLGTAIVKVFGWSAGITGWSEKALIRERIEYKATTITATQHASYFPGAKPVLFKLLWSPSDGKILGAQATGADGIDKRLDVMATALHGHMTIDDICHLELSYAPPFGSAKDVVNIAGFAAQNTFNGLLDAVRELPAPNENKIIVDCRPRETADLKPVEGAVNIPLAELRSRLNELDKEKPIVTVCALGKTSYFASRVLRENGFQASSLVGGLNMRQKRITTPLLPAPRVEDKKQEKVTSDSLPPIVVDTCGMACPGPIMKIKKEIGSIAEGQKMSIMSTDSGFVSDLPAFCKAHGLQFIGVESNTGGVYTGHLMKPAVSFSAESESTKTNLQPRKGLSLVVFSGDMDKVMAALVLANGEVAMGGHVSMFFTFWGLSALKKGTGGSSAPKSLLDRLFSLLTPSSLSYLPLSNLNFMGMGSVMMKYQMQKKNLPNVESLMASARESGVKMIGCSMSMDAMGISKDELLDGIQVGGVADFLSDAHQSSTTLFI